MFPFLVSVLQLALFFMVAQLSGHDCSCLPWACNHRRFKPQDMTANAVGWGGG